MKQKTELLNINTPFNPSDEYVFAVFGKIVDDFKDDEACDKLSKIYYRHGYKITVSVECDEESEVQNKEGREF